MQVVNGTIQWAEGNCVITVAPQSSGGKFNFRGEYSSGATYVLNDMITISTGAGTGTYMCVLTGAAPGTIPSTGAPYFVALPTPTPGVWL